MVNITRPNSPDLSVRNAKEFVYVKGDATTDGSLRFDPSLSNPGAVAVQLRTEGVWDRTALDIAASTLHIGHDLSLAAAGEWLETDSITHEHKSLVPHIEFNDAVGTQFAHSPLVSLKYYRYLFQQDVRDELIGTSISDTLVIGRKALNSKIYLKGGSVAPTEPVTLSFRKDSPSGDLFWRRGIPPSTFMVNKFGPVEGASAAPNPAFSIIDSTQNGLANGEVVHINGSQHYDGFHSVSDVTTDTFQIARPFVGDDVGEWVTVNDSEIDLLGDISSNVGDVWYITVECATPMSIITDSSGNWWGGLDLQLIDPIDIVLDNQMFSAEADVYIFDDAEYVLDKRFQTGTYRLP